ncbi:hypothetical protein ACFXKG_19155 [Streptomyces sp. NPDC059255]
MSASRVGCPSYHVSPADHVVAGDISGISYVCTACCGHIWS